MVQTKKIVISLLAGLILLFPTIAEAVDMCVCNVKILDGSGEGGRAAEYIGTGDVGRKKSGNTGWKYFKVKNFPNSLGESIAGYEQPLASGILEDAPFVKYLQNHSGADLNKQAEDFLVALTNSLVTTENCSASIDGVWEKMDDGSVWGVSGSYNPVDHVGTCEVLNCMDGSAYCAGRDQGWKRSVLEEQLYDLCKSDDINKTWKRLNLVKVGETEYWWRKDPPSPEMTWQEEFVKFERASIQVHGWGDANQAVKKAKAEKVGVAFHSVGCYVHDKWAPNTIFFAKEDKPLVSIPEGVFSKGEVDLADINLTEKNREEWNFTIDNIYGTGGMTGLNWKCSGGSCKELGVKIIGNSGAQELVFNKKGFLKTGNYEVQLTLSVAFKDDLYGSQNVEIEVPKWKVKAYADCAQFVKEQGCDSDQNQEDCKKKCEAGYPSCSYIGRKQCVDKTNYGVTPVDKVNHYSETNYGMPDNYDGPLPKCAFSGLCRESNDLVVLFVKIADFFFGIIGSVSFLFFIAGGFMMIISLGNSDRVSAGKKIMTAAITGMVIAFSAYLLVNFFLTMMGVDATFRVIK